jgi:hypothetical protein
VEIKPTQAFPIRAKRFIGLFGIQAWLDALKQLCCFSYYKQGERWNDNHQSIVLDFVTSNF